MWYNLPGPKISELKNAQVVGRHPKNQTNPTPLANFLAKGRGGFENVSCIFLGGVGPTLNVSRGTPKVSDVIIFSGGGNRPKK